MIIEELWFENTPDKAADKSAAASFAAQLAQSEGLKTFPVVAQKILSLFANADFKVADVTRVLEEDPALAAGVLRVANSAVFAPTRPITQMGQAFVRIGASHVKEIVCAVATMELFRDVDGIGMRVRDHCAAVAGLVQHIGGRFLKKPPDGIFLAGLLHDIGKLMLIDSHEMDYPLDGSMPLPPNIMHEFERRRLGYDHAVLAGHIVSSWHFGRIVSKMIAWHHQPQRAFLDDEVRSGVALLRLADQVDFILAQPAEDYIRDIHTLARSEEAQLLQISDEALQEIWPTLDVVRNDALTIFSVQH